ncbi:Fe(2+) transport protein 1-like protein [Tanacetum coccineum]
MMSDVGTLMIDSYMMSGFKKYSRNNNGIKNPDPEIKIMGHCHGDVTSRVDDRASQLRRYPVVLERGIVVHSIVIGLSMGASDNICTIIPLVAALCFHQFFEGIGLGVTTPLGIALRILLSIGYQEYSSSALVVVGVLNAVLAGLVNYMALVDLLAAHFLGKRLQDDMKLQSIAYLAVLLGVGGMSVMAIWA